MTAAVRVEVVQGLARELSLAVPAGLVVNEVKGATVGDWEVAGGLLRVRLLDPVTLDASFVVSGEVRAPRDGEIPCAARPRAVGRARNAAASRSTWWAPAKSPAARRAASSRPIRRSSATSWPAASRRRWSRSACGRWRAPRRARSPSGSSATRRRPCSSPTSRRRAIARSSRKTAGCSSRRATPYATTSAAS